MRRSILAAWMILTVVGTAELAQAETQAADPAGTWLTQDKDARIRVSRCGNGLCGSIVWLRDPLEDGEPSRDKNNPNPALRKRPLIGLHLFQSMAAAGPNKWSGRIYNSDDGKSYEGSVSMVDRQHLKIQGCSGAFCGAELWTRAR